MKKIAVLTIVSMLAACAELSSFTGSGATAGDSTQAKMKTCLMSEATSRYQAGTLFTNSIRETASNLVSTCMKKLALQSVGISEESQSTAESIISNLKNWGSAE